MEINVFLTAFLFFVHLYSFIQAADKQEASESRINHMEYYFNGTLDNSSATRVSSEEKFFMVHFVNFLKIALKSHEESKIMRERQQRNRYNGWIKMR